MSEVSIDKKVPSFRLPATGDKELSLDDFAGKNLVVYFYPKDNTPGCTTEGQEFRDLYAEFQDKNTAIVGVSRDSVKSHEKFKEKQNFPFDLIADRDEELCRLFDVIKEKNMYGKIRLGVERSTFLIDADGVLRHEWRKVKAKGHATTVLETVNSL